MLICHARQRLRTLRVCAVAASVLGAAAGLSAPSASAQGLFEALFGPRFQDPPPPVYQPPQTYAPDAYERLEPRRARPLSAPRAKRNAASLRDERRARRTRPAAALAEARPDRPALVEPAKPAPYVAPQVMPGPLGRFLRDPTLRNGDVVATAEGLMVFWGGRGARHTERDFVPLARAGVLVARDARTELAKLDRAVDANPTAEAPPRPAPIVAQDEGRARRR